MVTLPAPEVAKNAMYGRTGYFSKFMLGDFETNDHTIRGISRASEEARYVVSASVVMGIFRHKWLPELNAEEDDPAYNGDATPGDEGQYSISTVKNSALLGQFSKAENNIFHAMTMLAYQVMKRRPKVAAKVMQLLRSHTNIHGVDDNVVLGTLERRNAGKPLSRINHPSVGII
ncbi:hypothetical protein BLS_006767 [Venturia inaequalis]|uniref:Uncharacterized protein n=1 Tax=Venturia inaequalis TaxID=5025 RepID=A0A8H3YN84_VENIN|nr:hypothetical protein BLS_006767 [Venturia inaequalis]